jgi:hypothetical protein
LVIFLEASRAVVDGNQRLLGFVGKRKEAVSELEARIFSLGSTRNFGVQLQEDEFILKTHGLNEILGVTSFHLYF